ncbi:MAG: ATP synthase F1 subunit delta [Dehalococcoidales bacterium]
MAKKFSARRYSRAVFELVGKGRLDERQAEMDKMVSLVQDTTVVAYLENPRVRFGDKARVLRQALGDVDAMMLNMVYLLLAKGQLHILPDVAAEFQHLADSHHGIERARVTTAVPLDDEARLKLSQHLGDITGKKVLLEPEVDPGLIGGVVVRVAGKLLDGSTRGKLAALKREITGA